MVRSAFRKEYRDAAKLQALGRQRLRQTPGLRLDYLELVDGSTLRLVRRPAAAKRGDLLAVAAFVGKTRLIDNVRL
jgi:pantothenate synthetase